MQEGKNCQTEIVCVSPRANRWGPGLRAHGSQWKGSSQPPRGLAQPHTHVLLAGVSLRVPFQTARTKTALKNHLNHSCICLEQGASTLPSAMFLGRGQISKPAYPSVFFCSPAPSAGPHFQVSIPQGWPGSALRLSAPTAHTAASPAPAEPPKVSREVQS